ncbi:hypothetical protein K474DRAFT_1680825, partial [Panus rudis PR-1116 ss-1]
MLQYRREWQKTGIANDHISYLSLSPNGDCLAIAGRKEVSILTRETGKVKCILRGQSQVTTLQWIPGGSPFILLCTFEDGFIVTLTIHANGEVDVACEQAVSHVIHNCSLNASGTLLATGSENDVRIWEKDGEWWKEMQRLKSPPTYRDNHLVPMELVSLHWRKISRAKETLVTSYKRHGI